MAEPDPVQEEAERPVRSPGKGNVLKVRSRDQAAFEDSKSPTTEEQAQAGGPPDTAAAEGPQPRSAGELWGSLELTWQDHVRQGTLERALLSRALRAWSLSWCLPRIRPPILKAMVFPSM